MLLSQKLKEDLKESMRSRDADRVSVIRLLMATIKNKEIEKGKDAHLSDDEIFALIASAAKQRTESIEQFEKAGRSDLVEKETKERHILQLYLPEPLTEAELQIKVAEAIAQAGAVDMKKMGEVMKILVPPLVGRADGNLLRKMVQTALQGN